VGPKCHYAVTGGLQVGVFEGWYVDLMFVIPVLKFANVRNVVQPLIKRPDNPEIGLPGGRA
jgi:hypothetical protein